MHFSTPLFLAAAAFTSLAQAQNPFSFNTAPSVTAGVPFQITWSPSTGTTDTVTLVLKQGPPALLVTVLTIASHIQNVGSYAWAVPATLVKGSNYTFQIIDDGNTAIVNYSIQFSIDSKVTSSSAASGSASATASGTASGTATSASSTASSSSNSSSTATATAKSAAGRQEVKLVAGWTVLLGAAVALLI